MGTIGRDGEASQPASGLLEQYKLYVEMADRVSSRRDSTNRFYVSVLSVLLAVVSIVVSTSTLTSILRVVLICVGALGILLCMVWLVHIRAFRQLNSGKFRVIHEMEKQLAFAPYDKEWEILGRGKEKFKYRKLTSLEQWAPIALGVLYVVLLVCVVCLC